jgi:hypothetical protein
MTRTATFLATATPADHATSSQKAAISSMLACVKPNASKNANHCLQEFGNQHQEEGKIDQAKNKQDAIGNPATGTIANRNLSAGRFSAYHRTSECR